MAGILDGPYGGEMLKRGVKVKRVQCPGAHEGMQPRVSKGGVRCCDYFTWSATNGGELKELGPLLQNPVGTLVSTVLLSWIEDGTGGQGYHEGR